MSYRVGIKRAAKIIFYCMKKIMIKIISAGFTFAGCYLLIIGDMTNGFLAIIIGELTDMPKSY